MTSDSASAAGDFGTHKYILYSLIGRAREREGEETAKAAAERGEVPPPRNQSARIGGVNGEPTVVGGLECHCVTVVVGRRGGLFFCISFGWLWRLVPTVRPLAAACVTSEQEEFRR